MTIKRIVLDIETNDVAKVRQFYEDLFCLSTVMDMGWVATLATGTDGPIQVSVVSDGGSGAPVPDMSIEVDNLQEVHDRANSMGAEIVYPLTVEPWGVHRFFVRDPAGNVLNILHH